MTGCRAPLSELSPEALARAAPLAGIGRKSGDLVLGLSAVRRTDGLALILVESGISPRTLNELGRHRQRGVQVYQVQALLPLTAMLGRSDAHVIGVKRGALADGMMAKLGGVVS
jgi:hypothetical protein